MKIKPPIKPKSGTKKVWFNYYLELIGYEFRTEQIDCDTFFLKIARLTHYFNNEWKKP